MYEHLVYPFIISLANILTTNPVHSDSWVLDETHVLWTFIQILNLPCLFLIVQMLPIYHPVQQPMAQPPPPQLLYPPHLAPPGMLAYHHSHHPHHAPPSSTLAYTHSLMRPHHHPHHHPHHMPPPHPHYSSTLDAALLHPSEQPHRMHRGARGGGSNTAAASRRRKSDSDRNGNGGVSNPAFVYHGLDRAIADSFLKEQERQNVSIECTSLSGRGADVAM